MQLDLSSFIKALTRLKEALDELPKDPDNAFVKDAIVQRFEYTYELAFKMIRRCLSLAAADNQEIEGMFFSDLIRTANQKGLLLHDLPRWLDYRNMRNSTIHTYNVEKADAIVALAPDFYEEAAFLLTRLQQKLREHS